MDKVIDLVSDDDDLDFLDDEDISTLPPPKKKKKKKTPLIYRDYKYPKDYKYEAISELGDFLFLMILGAHNIDCWLEDPETKNLKIIWDMDEPPLKRLSIFGHYGQGGRSVLKKVLLECLKTSYGGFAVARLALFDSEEGHRNFIVVNLNEKKAFRYDPNGKTTSATFREGLLDDQLTGLFASIGFRYVGSDLACPDDGIQVIADDGVGCQIWAALFVDTFLHFPKLSVAQIENIIKERYDTKEKLQNLMLGVAYYTSTMKKKLALKGKIVIE